MPLELTFTTAEPANAATASGGLRGVATAVGHGRGTPPPIAWPADVPLVTGRVTSGGRFEDARVRAALALALGSELASALRNEFEWYLCRGAFFHTDAHYDGVLFGVWGVAGPAAEIVFPRAGVRLDGSPGSVVVFDPFEVHGVLARGHAQYAAEDYEGTAASVYVGFELALTDAVARIFRVPPVGPGRTLSSRTRVDPVTGGVA